MESKHKRNTSVKEEFDVDKEELKQSQICFFENRKGKKEQYKQMFDKRNALKDRLELENKCTLELEKMVSNPEYDMELAPEKLKEAKELKLKEELVEEAFKVFI